MNDNKVIIISAPSGTGKTTLIKHLMEVLPVFEFSISATSRQPRKGEINGKDYYFLSAEDFRCKIENNEFIEWEEVYPNRFYGTLKSEIERIHRMGKVAIFDVDVMGGVNLKQKFGEKALSIFIKPPSLEELELRLRIRGTDSDEEIKTRLERAAYELNFASKFDTVIVNETLDKSKPELVAAVKRFLGI
ncbi:MAG TPA: guanylate kinase [Salinivirgaceae bacterium]|nr:guanylate kinase [Salinivirgaceae bacterium]